MATVVGQNESLDESIKERIMKTMHKALCTMVAAAALGFSMAAQAQNQAPCGQGVGAAPCGGAGMGPGMGRGMGGMGPGMGPGRGWRASQGNTFGFAYMTPQERAEHQTKMGSVKTYDECKAYVDDHRTKMEARAKAQGKTLTHMRADPCADMRAAGRIK
jgi:hypothetical protein